MEAPAVRAGVVSWIDLPVGALDDDVHRDVGGLACVVAQQGHHMGGLAGPVDAAVQPDIGVERARIGQAGHAAIRQVERGAAEVEQRVVLATEHLDRTRGGRPLAVQQRSGEAADAVSVRGGLAEDFVVLGEQAKGGAGAGLHVGVAAHLDGQAVGAAPNGGGEVGVQDHLHRGLRVGCAVAGTDDQRVEAGAGGGERIGHRQCGMGGAVGLPGRDGRGALPDDAAGLLADLVGVPGLDGLAETGVADEADDVALGQPGQGQLDRGEIDRAQADGGGLAARQDEHAGVEIDARAAVGHRDVEGGVLDQGEAALAGHAGAQRDPGGGAGGQAGDADLVALAGDAGARDWRLELHPVLGVEIVAARGGDGEVDAGARGFGFGFGGDAADQDAGGAARLIQLLDDGLGVGGGGALGGGLQRLDLLGGAVQRLQRVGHQQERRDLGGAVLDVGEILPGGVQRVACIRRCAVHLRIGQRQPLRRRGVAQGNAAFEGSDGGGPVGLADGGGSFCLGLLAGLRRATGGEPRGQRAGVGVGVGFQAGESELVRPGGTTGEPEQCRQQPSETPHDIPPVDPLPVQPDLRLLTIRFSRDPALAATSA